MSNELPHQDDHQPHGDPLPPVREQAEGAEPMPAELQSQLDQVESQNLGEAGSGPGSPPPRLPEDTPQPDVAHAKLQGEDEGPVAEGGGGLETAGGGGR